MSRLEDLEEQLHHREIHTFCKKLLSITRKKYKCSLKSISCIKDMDGWSIYIDPEGYVGHFRECCKWSAMQKAVCEKFTREGVRR